VDPALRDRLRALNRHFYAKVAREFDASRRQPWRGWSTTLELLRQQRQLGRREPPLRILDVGCGNGRFARFLDARLGERFDYLGIDANRELLERACEATAGLEFGRTRWLEADVLEPDALAGLDADWVVLFGVLHHVPSFAARRALVERLVSCLAPGGLLCLTVWRFAERARSAGRLVAHATIPDDPGGPILAEQLEPGDHLLRFGDDPSAVRYCHEVSDEELARLLADLNLQEFARFEADGRRDTANTYLIVSHDLIMSQG